MIFYASIVILNGTYSQIAMILIESLQMVKEHMKLVLLQQPVLQDRRGVLLMAAPTPFPHRARNTSAEGGNRRET